MLVLYTTRTSNDFSLLHKPDLKKLFASHFADSFNSTKLKTQQDSDQMNAYFIDFIAGRAISLIRQNSPVFDLVEARRATFDMENLKIKISLYLIHHRHGPFDQISSIYFDRSKTSKDIEVVS
jgi:hypothetical protein